MGLGLRGWEVRVLCLGLRVGGLGVWAHGFTIRTRGVRIRGFGFKGVGLGGWGGG